MTGESWSEIPRFLFGGRMVTIEEIYAKYAEALDKPELTEAEKRQAFLNAILNKEQIQGFEFVIARADNATT